MRCARKAVASIETRMKTLAFITGPAAVAKLGCRFLAICAWYLPPAAYDRVRVRVKVRVRVRVRVG